MKSALDIKEGEPVLVKKDDGSVVHTVATSDPWQLGDGTWVVKLKGFSGGYSLARVTPLAGTPGEEVAIEPEGPKPGQIPLTVSIESKMFADWIAGNLRDIEHTQLLMAQPLTDDPNMLQPQLAEVEAWFERANALFADAKNFYYLAKRESLVARQDGLTDLDRESMQKGAVSNQRRVMDTLEGIVESIKSRLMLGMNLRKAFAAETTKDRP